MQATCLSRCVPWYPQVCVFLCSAKHLQKARNVNSSPSPPSRSGKGGGLRGITPLSGRTAKRSSTPQFWLLPTRSARGESEKRARRFSCGTQIIRCLLVAAFAIAFLQLAAIANPNWSALNVSVPGDLAGYSDLTAVSWGTNRIDVFARGNDNTLRHRVYEGTWHDWHSLEGNIQGAPAAVCSGEGRLDVFVRGADDALWYRRFENGLWSEWRTLAGILTSDPAVASWGEKRLDVFVRGADNGCWHIADLGNAWFRWEPLFGKLSSGPTIIECEPDYIDVGAFDEKNQFVHSIWDGARWQEWAPVSESRKRSKPKQGFLHSLLQDKEFVRYNTRTWRTDEGLPHDSVQAITQTKDGWLWIGTVDGLVRFDGLRFTPLDLRGLCGLKRASITALVASSDGGLWIGADEEGLFRWHNGKVLRYGALELAGSPVRTLFEASDSSLWIGTTRGLIQWKDGMFKRLTEENGLSRNFVRAIHEDNAQRLWVGTSIGLNCLSNGAVIAVHTNLPNLSLRSLCLDRFGKLWIGSSHGVFRFDDKTVYDKLNGLPNNFVGALHQDRRGDLWIGTYGGLSRFTALQVTADAMKADASLLVEANAEGAAFDQINVIYEDSEGDLWLGAKDGLHRLKAGPFTACTMRDGLSHNNVLSVLQDKPGSLWITTWGGGLNRLKEGRFEVFNNASHALADELLSLCEDHDGGLWIGADFNGGLFRWKDGGFTVYGRDRGFEDLAARVVYEDRKLNLWIGTSSGLNVFRDGKFIRYTTTNGLPGNIVRAIREDREGHLWVGTDGGLCQVREGEFENGIEDPDKSSPQITFHVSQFTQSVLSIFEDAEGVLWIGAAGGLARYRNEQFTLYTTREGLFTDEIYEVLEDDRANLWMSSRKGIFRVSKKSFDDFDVGKVATIPCVSYGRADGMESVQCNGVSKPSAWKGTDGRLWFATTRGFVVVNPASIALSNTPPPVVIEEVVFDKRVQSLKFKGQSPDRVARDSDLNVEPETLNLVPGRGELEFHYTALSLRSPEKTRFKYKLEGVDPDWVDANARRSAFYNNVPPGQYTFHVMAGDQDGIWNSIGSSVRLQLQPHLWQTWWFRAFTICIGIGAVGMSVRYLTKRRMQRKLQRLEQQHAIEKERARIAQDMHDDLGARLTEILMLSGVTASGRGGESGMKASAEKVVVAAEDMVRNMDGIVWAINPRNDSLKHLTLYFYEYVERFLGATAIRCRWEVPEDLPPIPLAADVRHNLFLILKEALNNTVKYSGATEVWIRLAFAEDVLRLTIQDNGCGLRNEPGGRVGHGLSGMRKRAEDIGGCLELQSEPGEGMRIQVQIPIKTHL